MADTALYDTLLQVAQKRRNNRKFKSDPIPDGYIEKIIDVARWAPSGFHTQPWGFVPKEVRSIKYILHYNACGKDDFRSKELVVKEAAITKAWCLSAH